MRCPHMAEEVFYNYACISVLQKKPDWSKKGDEKKVKDEEVEA